MIKPKPNFFIAGAAKAGTTSLRSYLIQHPEIFMTKEKEPNFFGIDPAITYRNTADENNQMRKCDTYEAYLNLYNGSETYQARGEASVSILYYPKAIEDICERIENVKIIIALRHPTDRAYSNYMHHLRDGYENVSFEEALELEEEREQQNYSFGYQYRKGGEYSGQIGHILKYIPTEKVKFVLFEDLTKRTNEVLRKICQFLEVDPDYEFDSNYSLNKSGVLNPTSTRTKLFNNVIKPETFLKKRLRKIVPVKLRKRFTVFKKHYFIQDNLVKIPMKQETRTMLNGYFLEEINETEKIIQRDLSAWKN